MSDAIALLQQYLIQLANRGVTHVAWTGWQPGEADPPVSRQPVPPSLSELEFSQMSEPPELAVSSRAPAVEPARISPVDPDKVNRLAALAKEAAVSGVCRALGSLRETMVFATGSPDATLMFVGEAPGVEEERLGEPFVGPAGKLLTKIITAMGFNREQVYISNICKFRPVTDDGRPQGSRNRPPTRKEMEACLPFITEEIHLIQPRVIVAVGATAANGLGIEGSVGSIRGKFHEFEGIPVMVTYHPSYLLRREIEGGGLREKRLVWEDMLKVMERLGLPISEKQRAFFTNPKA